MCPSKPYLGGRGSSKGYGIAFFGLRTPRPATGVSRALRARSVPGTVPESETGGVRESVWWGVSEVFNLKISEPDGWQKSLLLQNFRDGREKSDSEKYLSDSG